MSSTMYKNKFGHSLLPSVGFGDFLHFVEVNIIYYQHQFQVFGLKTFRENRLWETIGNYFRKATKQKKKRKGYGKQRICKTIIGERQIISNFYQTLFWRTKFVIYVFICRGDYLLVLNVWNQIYLKGFKENCLFINN